jgi:hypothetical protein
MEKMKNLFNKLSSNQIAHLKTISWIAGVIFTIWLVGFMLVNFTDLTIITIILAVFGFFVYNTYIAVYTLVKHKSSK